jgi:pimeloyl-ACP methyl ester carboxylesterase
MQQLVIPFKKSSFAVQTWGSGPQLVLCIHGYGETAQHFSFLQQLGHHYTIAAIDLPYHGNTTWQGTEKLLPADLLAVIKTLWQELYNSNKQLQDKITLLGYSLGGRVALSLYQHEPGLFNKLVLLAPDGLKLNRWYWLATQTYLGNRLFKYTMQHPAWFFKVLQWLNKLGMVNTSIFKFVNFYIGDATVRSLLYQRWTVLSAFRPNLGKVQQLIHKQDTPVRLVYGQYDKIIVPVVGERFIKKIPAQGEMRILAAGHQLLQEKWLADFTKVIAG